MQDTVDTGPRQGPSPLDDHELAHAVSLSLKVFVVINSTLFTLSGLSIFLTSKKKKNEKNSRLQSKRNNCVNRWERLEDWNLELTVKLQLKSQVTCQHQMDGMSTNRTVGLFTLPLPALSIRQTYFLRMDVHKLVLRVV